MVLRGRPLAAFGLLSGLGAAFAFWLGSRPDPYPRDLRGTLYFVSDREGIDALYVRHLPPGDALPLATTAEPVKDPALSPDGSRLAFVMGGRIGLLSLPGGSPRFLTLGVDFQDAQPAWRPDGKGLVVSTRARD